MANLYLRQSPLAHLHLDARAVGDAASSSTGVEIGEHRFRHMLNLRGHAKDAAFSAAVKKAIGCALPQKLNTVYSKSGGPMILALGPDEWLIVSDDDAGTLEIKLGKELKGQHASITAVGEGRTVIKLGGAHARDVLAKGCPLDLHPMAFAPGQSAQTTLARTDILLHCLTPGRGKAEVFDIYVARSFAEYAWTWIEDAGREHGVRVTMP